MKKLITILAFGLVSGCINTKPDITVQTVKTWEGHYVSVQQMLDNTKNMELEKGESIWVLSNNTLYRLLSNVKKDQ